tara:strand:- start:179 stop:601 length:423 start_codon:yes stop_codon:yes gene_type:complete
MEEEIWTPSQDIPDGKCTICRIDIQGHGNNPSPVKEEGKCCDMCNSLVVLPHRLRASGMTEDEVQSYLETLLSKEQEKVEETEDGATVIRTKTGTTIVSGGNITINGKKIRPGGYNPRDYENWRHQYDPNYRSYRSALSK